MVRLVKGAYWDTEVKRAQERGLADYPVFTRKAMTDLCYMACVRASCLPARPRLYPQFATHNALTVASVIEEAGGVDGYEFQRLHGMGEALYEALHRRAPGVACRVYAPVGGHRDLLAYLVRRLAGERRELVVRVGRGRSVGAGRRNPEAAAGLDRGREPCAPSAHPAAARSLRPARQEFGGRRVRRPREPRGAARGVVRSRHVPRRWSMAERDGAAPVFADRRRDVGRSPRR